MNRQTSVCQSKGNVVCQEKDMSTRDNGTCCMFARLLEANDAIIHYHTNSQRIFSVSELTESTWDKMCLSVVHWQMLPNMLVVYSM